MDIKDALNKASDAEAAKVATPAPVPSKNKFGKNYIADMACNFVGADGDRIAVVGGLYVPKCQEDQDQLDYHAANGTIVAVGE